MNSLFIGLGGAGCSAVAEYAKMIQNCGAVTNDEFLYFDTEVAMKESYPIMGNDFIHLGSVNPGSRHTINKLVQEANEKVHDPNEGELEKNEAKQFLAWFDPSIRSGEPLNKGAEGVRMMSRAMLYADYDRIKQIIGPKSTYIVNNLNKDRRIYIVSGTCGGTGAGTVLDFLYMIQEIIYERRRDQANDPDVSLLLIMPQGYINGITDPSNVLYIPYRTNPYALFDELNGCMKDYNGTDSYRDVVKNDTGDVISVGRVTDTNAGKRFHFYRCCGNDVNAFPFTVCMNAYLFDSVDSNTGETLSTAQRAANVGNFLFIMEAANQAQNNLNTTLSNQLRVCKFTSRHKDFINGFSATGMFIAQSWEELTRKYVHDKMLYQMVKYGFIGGDDTDSYDETVISEDRKKTVEGIDKLIKTYDYATSLNVILQDLKEEGLNSVFKYIQDSVNSKGNAILDIFKDSTKGKSVEDLAKGMNLLLQGVRNNVYNLTAEWMKTYNLQHALALVETLDNYYDDLYLTSAGFIKECEMKIDWKVWDKDKKRRECCEKLFENYVNYLVYRNLSNANDGYLDKCRDNLKAAINAISIKDTDASYGVKIGDLESDFKTYLNRLKNDNKRRIYPSLDELYNYETTTFVAGNEVERKFASIVAQTPDGRPLLSRNAKGDDGNELSNLLYLYKDECIRDLSTSEVNWASNFEMNENTIPATYGQKVKVAYERFVKEALKKAENMSQKNNSLSIPFPALNTQEQQNLINTFRSFNQISLSVKYQRTSNTHTSIVVGDLTNNLNWLNAGLFPVNNGQAGYNQMESIPVPSTDLPDRVVLLYVQYGHALNNYLYYSSYREKYDYIVKHPKERVNPTYNDMRFWAANGNIGAYFTSLKEQAEKTGLINNWKGFYDVLLKFVSLFLYNILHYHFTSSDRTGLDLLDKMNVNDFLKLQRKPTNAYKSITFYRTLDYKYGRDNDNYTPTADMLSIDFDTTYGNLTDLRATVPFFEFWNEILLALNSALDKQGILIGFTNAYRDISRLYNDSRSLDKLSELRSKYLITDQQTNTENVNWFSLISRFISISKK